MRLYIGDLDMNVGDGSMMSKFAGDTKVCDVRDGEEDCLEIRLDISHLES